jgi:hypothetical protein
LGKRRNAKVKTFWENIIWPLGFWIFCIILPFAVDFKVGCVISGIVIFAWYGESLGNEQNNEKER